jgi:hypothetical protein
VPPFFAAGDPRFVAATATLHYHGTRFQWMLSTGCARLWHYLDAGNPVVGAYIKFFGVTRTGVNQISVAIRRQQSVQYVIGTSFTSQLIIDIPASLDTFSLSY